MAYPNLKAEIARNGITGKELANRIGVSEVTFSRWINGASKPYIDQAIKIAEILKSDVTYLFTA